MYWYESHMSGIYYTEEPQEWDDLYCEQCGDSDWELGNADTFEEAFELIRDKVSVCGSGGFSMQYIFPTLCEAYGETNNFPVCDDYECFVEASDVEILKRIAEITGKDYGIWKCEKTYDFDGKKFVDKEHCVALSKEEALEMFRSELGELDESSIEKIE